MKTKDELNTLKEDVETLNKKLAELTEEELEQVSGGEDSFIWMCKHCGTPFAVKFKDYTAFLSNKKCSLCGSADVYLLP